MQVLVDLGPGSQAILSLKVSVDIGCHGDTAVTQQLLSRAEIYPGFIEHGGISVPEHVGVNWGWPYSLYLLPEPVIGRGSHPASDGRDNPDTIPGQFFQNIF